ncbi:hypothetical protein WEI85_35030 [Actinomycetes bacterium KLBMP 9797]
MGASAQAPPARAGPGPSNESPITRLAGERWSAGAEFSRAQLVTRMAPRLANTMVAVVLSGFAVLTVAGLLQAGMSMGRMTLALVLILALMALQLGYFSRPGARLRRGRSYVALAAQAVLAYLPMLEFGLFWTSFPGLVAGSALIALPATVAVPVLVGVLISVAAIDVHLAANVTSFPYALAYGLISTMLTALITYGLTRMARLVGEIHAAREELSRMAVAEERLRLARDVHDMCWV